MPKGRYDRSKAVFKKKEIKFRPKSEMQVQDFVELANGDPYYWSKYLKGRKK